MEYPVEDDPKARLEWAIHNLRRLTELDAPATIKAHALIQVLLPKLVRIVGVDECMQELVTVLAKGWALEFGMCVLCRKNRPMGGSGVDADICPRCSAEQDQFEAQMEDES